MAKNYQMESDMGMMDSGSHWQKAHWIATGHATVQNTIPSSSVPLRDGFQERDPLDYNQIGVAALPVRLYIQLEGESACRRLVALSGTHPAVC